MTVIALVHRAAWVLAVALIAGCAATAPPSRTVPTVPIVSAVPAVSNVPSILPSTAAPLARPIAMAPQPDPLAAIDSDSPPPTPREFRAAWIATVNNIDWPSRRGLTVAEQKAEIIRIVERASDLRLNALIFQVRPAADALYLSALEPWSEYLTGEQGRAPEPYYDPLQMWIDEAHRRGIALHAWFNPYRARHTSAIGPNARRHIASTNPGVVKQYGGHLWMDPGEALAAQRTLDVILDVVRRYDIDGVHIDDYFYPYPVSVAGSDPPVDVDFPDTASWQRWRDGGGTSSRADWRRENVTRLVEAIYFGIHREKPWVRFGISPFGVGRPDRRPPGIAGFSQYDKLYADVELWLGRGWLDYLAPQLYWPMDQREQSFGVLLEYWLAQNKERRHIWPGLFTSRIEDSTKSWLPAEILDQIALTRTKNMEQGHVHFSMSALVGNRKGISDRLRAIAYRDDALIPAAPWLAPANPFAPELRVDADEARREIRIVRSNPVRDDAAHYAAWVRVGGVWRFAIAPRRAETGADLSGLAAVIPYARIATGQSPERVVAFAIDRYGIESPRVTWTARDRP